MDTVIHQQDGATLHCSNASLEYLHRYFSGDRLIFRLTDHPGLHVLQTYSLWINFCRGAEKTGSMLTIPNYPCAQE